RPPEGRDRAPALLRDAAASGLPPGHGAGRRPAFRADPRHRQGAFPRGPRGGALRREGVFRDDRRRVRGSAPGSPGSLGFRDFRLFQRLIHEEAGIQLSDAKRVLVEGRLARRLRELQLDFGAYYARVEADEQERTRTLDCSCTNETHFSREPRQFDFLEGRVFPEWQARADAGRMPRRVRVWSAGCSTGEEPYSVAMAFLARFP